MRQTIITWNAHNSVDKIGQDNANSYADVQLIQNGCPSGKY